jgi:hypothetical protein
MSSTRRSTTGEFHQERFCSAPEFEGDAINGLAAAKRIAIVKDKAAREILWFIQWRSIKGGGLQELCEELLESFPERVGTSTMVRIAAHKQRSSPTAAELKAIRSEWTSSCSPEWAYSEWLHDVSEDDPQNGWIVPEPETPKEELERYAKRAREYASQEGLLQHLKLCCLDPKANIADGVWFFHDLFGALKALRSRFVEAAKTRLADTAVTTEINRTLDFWFSRRRMVLIEGVAGIGRTVTTRAWCDAHAGLVRYVEVPSSSDERSFYASVARELGVARGTSFNGQQIKVRVEEMLATGEIALAFDESQYLWTQAMHPRKTPDRLLWIKSTFDAGTPIALIAHVDFTKWQEHYVKRTLWTDEQFERRLNRRLRLPTEHSRDDMLKIARTHLPQSDARMWKLLAAYALGTEKKQASAIFEAVESARYRAEQAGRDRVSFADIEAALIHDHGFLTAGSVIDARAAGSGLPEQTDAKGTNRLPILPVRRQFGGRIYESQLERSLLPKL